MHQSLLVPVLVLLSLTFVVWVLLYFRRISAIRDQRIRPQSLKTPADVERLLPEYAQLPAYNFKNLLELPLVFYVVCGVIEVQGGATTFELIAAWGFVVGRIVHSAVHCTFNRVGLRFMVYALSAIFLWSLLLSVFFRSVFPALI